ncbi:MAG: tRNA lysidine(34) synthetase TilS [Proteobacteria bacterium]|nr:tRNA lysidine(34) synthetase TilS [Pseudomonadota bacterium]
MHSVSKNLSAWVATHLLPKQKLIVAYSGGRDSHVLLDALVRLKAEYDFQLTAIHVNHGLQKDAPQWAAHCQKWCDTYDISLKVINLSFNVKKGESLEEQARLNRYQALEAHVLENDLLLTAHSQDDQAETFLLQLMRGSGIKGLASIAPLKRFSKGYLARPLLNVCRGDIADYASEHKLCWIEDPSNQNLSLRRNFVRHQILYPLEKLHQNVSVCISRSAKHCAHALSLLEDYLEQDLVPCLGDVPHTLNITVLKQHSPIKQAYLFRLWLSKHQVALPNERKCEDMLKQLFCAAPDASPQITLGTHQLRRYQQFIYILSSGSLPITKATSWDLQAPIKLADGAKWQAKVKKGRGLSKCKLHNQSVSVEYRELRPSKKLKKIFQSHQIPPWERQSIPLFYVGSALVGVGSLYLCKAWQVEKPEEEGIFFEKI